ncbi:MAG: iron-sulfur cluster assembly accessory protein [Verrucomicrobia bacterium]|nr:iron-sulfur cluster assembly accessory protein [Verrucomicrobiota bacterium]
MRMIQITERAAQHIRQLTCERDSSYGLRLAIEKGGCAGLSYGMTVAPSQPGDQSLEQNGARLFMAADSLQLLDGCTLDYEEELTHTGFKIVNPKAKQTCGCGTSFEA